MNQDLKFKLGQSVWFSREMDIETISGEIVGFFIPPGETKKEYYYQISYKGKVTNKEGNQEEEDLLTSLPAIYIGLTKDSTELATMGAKLNKIDEFIEKIQLFIEGSKTEIKFKEEQQVEAEKELKRYKELKEKFEKKSKE